MVSEESSAAGLYVHIPFCRSRCAYCDFCSVTDTGLIERFLDALCTEIDACPKEFERFDTIYMGGGTPSLLSLRQIEALLEKIYHAFLVLPDSEITIEVNPADWGRDDLVALRDLGINRISVGVQSLDEKELVFLGRRHSSRQAMRTMEDAVVAGFTNMSVDLIYGLPGQTFSRWQDSLAGVLRFGPAHLSCYELELKPHTPLGLQYERGELEPRTEDSLRDFFMRTSLFLEDAGYLHYEISSFAAGMDKASRHNRKYWDHTPYLGLGPSAHSFRGGRRWWNHSSLIDYLRDLSAARQPVSGSEDLDQGQLRLEAWFLGLRTRKGIDLQQYRRRFCCDLLEEKGPLLKEWETAGLVEIADGFIRPTRAGMAVADSLALL
ncbi:MAG: radical SAM family heme chaperone HemW [Syntrophaceae bacterium]